MRGGVCGRPFVVEAMKGEPMSAPENVRTVGGAAEFGVIDPVFVPTALVEVAEDAAARLDLSETGARTVHFSGKVFVVEGKHSNIKLTVPEDYAMLNMSLGVQPD